MTEHKCKCTANYKGHLSRACNNIVGKYFIFKYTFANKETRPYIYCLCDSCNKNCLPHLLGSEVSKEEYDVATIMYQ